MPITKSEGHKSGVVVAITDCRLETDGRGLIAEHGSTKFPANAGIQIRPHVGNLDVGKTSSLSRGHGGRTICEGTAVAGAGCQGGFKEWLYWSGVGVVGAVRSHAANCYIKFCVRVGEGLTAKRHHVRHAIEIDLGKLMLDTPAEISNLYRHLTAKAALNCKVPIVSGLRPVIEVNRPRISPDWIQNSVLGPPGQKRLRQSCRRCGERCR